MEAARRIASNAELRTIAEAGAGYVVDPFNRWWHVATCPRILNMTVGEAKWFAPTRPALAAYLEDRLASYPTAKPILGCKGCAGSETSGPRAASVLPPDTAGVVAAQMVSAPYVERSASGFAVWADECVRNESKATSTAGALRRLIADGVRALPAPNGPSPAPAPISPVSAAIRSASPSNGRSPRRSRPRRTQANSAGSSACWLGRRSRWPAEPLSDPGAAARGRNSSHRSLHQHGSIVSSVVLLPQDHRRRFGDRRLRVQGQHVGGALLRGRGWRGSACRPPRGGRRSPPATFPRRVWRLVPPPAMRRRGLPT